MVNKKPTAQQLAISANSFPVHGARLQYIDGTMPYEAPRSCPWVGPKMTVAGFFIGVLTAGTAAVGV